MMSIKKYSKAQVCRLLNITEGTYYSAINRGVFTPDGDRFVCEEEFARLKDHLTNRGDYTGRPKNGPPGVKTNEVLDRMYFFGITKGHMAEYLGISRQGFAYNLKKELSTDLYEKYMKAIDAICKNGTPVGDVDSQRALAKRPPTRANRSKYYIIERIQKYRDEGLSLTVISQRVGKSLCEVRRLLGETKGSMVD
jgi:AraC-like DNA-binding protein